MVPEAIRETADLVVVNNGVPTSTAISDKESPVASHVDLWPRIPDLAMYTETAGLHMRVNGCRMDQLSPLRCLARFLWQSPDR